MTLLVAGATGSASNAKKLQGAEEGAAAVTKRFRNAVLERQMVKISAAAAFYGAAAKKGFSLATGHSASGGGSGDAAVEGGDGGKDRPASLREEATAATKLAEVGVAQADLLAVATAMELNVVGVAPEAGGAAVEVDVVDDKGKTSVIRAPTAGASSSSPP
mmetsp:Transcript_20592/g.51115  ORF Transcript_20592/g.51115 Transcript_20592/m.51115 type:complete len:161 (-) Transcript_20592:208-690(-)